MAGLSIRIEASEESRTHCACCGHETRTIWGFADELEAGAARYLATYYLRWTPGQPLETHPAIFDLIFGPWGEGTSAEDRFAIALVHFVQDGKPGVMVIDADQRLAAQNDQVGRGLDRADVVGTELARQSFAIFDAVMLQDPRLRNA